MRILKSLLSALLLVGAVSAQNSVLNWKGYDTATISTFRADSFKVSKTMNLTNAENKQITFVYDDTANAGRAIDTVVCEIGYQLGYPIINLSGLQDTAWSNCIVIDTINSVAVSKRYNPLKYGGAAAWPIDPATETSTRPRGQIDTTIGTSSSAAVIPFLPLWSPYVRFYVKGLSGNTAHLIKSKWIFEQRAYINVRNF